jgi:hypothetical protein
VLSEALDIDVHLYVAPDTRLSQQLPNKLRPLLFRKGTHAKSASDRRMYLRFKNSHFIYMSKFGTTTAKTGQFANHDHYLTGTHDVATGMCVFVPVPAKFVVLLVACCFVAVYMSIRHAVHAHHLMPSQPQQYSVPSHLTCRRLVPSFHHIHVSHTITIKRCMQRIG